MAGVTLSLFICTRPVVLLVLKSSINPYWVRKRLGSSTSLRVNTKYPDTLSGYFVLSTLMVGIEKYKKAKICFRSILT